MFFPSVCIASCATVNTREQFLNYDATDEQLVISVDSGRWY